VVRWGGGCMFLIGCGSSVRTSIVSLSLYTGGDTQVSWTGVEMLRHWVRIGCLPGTATQKQRATTAHGEFVLFPLLMLLLVLIPLLLETGIRFPSFPDDHLHLDSLDSSHVFECRSVTYHPDCFSLFSSGLPINFPRTGENHDMN